MNATLSHDILALLGRPARSDDNLLVSGSSDPVFRTPWRIAEAGASALGAVGLALSDLWRLRTGRGQAVTVDRHAAAASLRSNTYVLRNGERPVSWDPLTGHYPTRDGRHMFLHTNHPHHRAGALRIAGAAADTKEALAAAVAKWDGLAIEEAIAAGGCVGGLTRSRDEWNAHPHGQAVSQLPLIDIVPIGDAPPRPLPEGDRPLSGVRVLDLTRVLAGPTSGRVLAENGADVLHVVAPHLPYQTELLMDTGHGKRCTWIDLREPAGVETLKGLIQDADVFTQGYRPGTVAGRGFSPEQVASLRPGIVYVSICAYGHEGPWAARRGFDSIVQNVTGLAATQGSLVKPRNLPVQALDYIAGYLGALGAMIGLARRVEQGGSWHVRVSLVQVAHWLASLGTVDPADGLAELPDNELAPLFMESDGPLGHIRHLKPVIQLSETPSFFAKPAEPLGTSAARWAA
ncbi:CoA-transferase family III [Enhydrobacter aerosaccus]|uniref:CoA-transferase family III n=1 Tax=Enhydrobacter aerosaccus TaxID=225324 RepID=A0A1T4NH50_9HYPH|nr:CoA transferase [Enhydrobacter aerosaccus]SJZ78485.1 CoA-transferase family III [Enhydrobacter aerosaccus]